MFRLNRGGGGDSERVAFYGFDFSKWVGCFIEMTKTYRGKTYRSI